MVRLSGESIAFSALTMTDQPSAPIAYQDVLSRWRKKVATKIAKWQATGEMWRLELMQELFICKMDDFLTEELSGLPEGMMMLGNGLTNRERREIVSDVRRTIRALTEEFFPY